MGKVVTATLVVDFSSLSDEASAEDDGALLLEVDSREDGLNKGRTQFYAGDSVYYLLFKTNNVTLRKQDSSAGRIGGAGSGSITVEEYLTFANAREASLRYPVASNFSHSWLGNNLGTPIVQNQTKVVIAEEGVGVLKVTYKAAFDAYVLANAASTISKVLIYAEGEIV